MDELLQYEQQVGDVRSVIENLEDPTNRCEAMHKFVLEQIDVWLTKIETVKDETEQ